MDVRGEGGALDGSRFEALIAAEAVSPGYLHVSGDLMINLIVETAWALAFANH